jgi:uncharacterized protein
VILVDANLLIYARSASSPAHAAARGWLNGKLNGPAAVGFPWHSLLAFVRLSANPRVFPRPLTIPDAWRQVEEWLDCQAVWIPMPTDRHRPILASLLAQVGGGPNLVSDAHLAALAIEHGLTLCSADGDFARFPGLRWENPLAGEAPRK